MNTVQSRQPFARPASIMILPQRTSALQELRIALQHETGLVVVPETTTASTQTLLGQSLHLDLVLIDAYESEIDECAMIGAVKEATPHISVLVITMHNSHEYLITLLRAGAVGYVRGDTPCPDVIAAIYEALHGHLVAPSGVATRALQVLATMHPDHPNPPLIHLTQRERDVLSLLVQQHTNRQIGQALKIGEGTVKTYVKRIFAKLGVSQRAQVANRVTELHLLDT